jgi:hypothetical protein
MAEKFVAKASEFTDGDRRIVFVGDQEIGVFRHDGQFYAYSNFCLHQGGPACEGLTIAAVEERLRPDKTSQGLYFSETEMHFVPGLRGAGGERCEVHADRGRASRQPDRRHGDGKRTAAGSQPRGV